MNFFKKIGRLLKIHKIREDEIPQSALYEGVDIFSENERRTNSFYHAISVAYKAVEFILIFAFLIFAISSAFGNAEIITREGLEYIVRDFALMLEENKNDASVTVRYNPDADRSFDLFGDGLAVCGMSGINIFTATGRRVCNQTFEYVSPIMRVSSKYAIVYDEGGSKYSVYNAFTRVYESELEHKIRGVAVSDNGYYAIITGDDEFSSSVEVYNSNFKLISRYRKNGYVVDVDINDENIIICTLGVEANGAYSTEMVYSEIGASDVIASEKVCDAFPLNCTLTDEGFLTVFKECVCFFDSNGSVTAEYDYEHRSLYSFDTDESGAVLLFKGDVMSKEYTAVSLDLSGREISDHVFSGTVYSMEYISGSAYILTDKCIIGMNENRVSELECNGADNKTVLLAIDSDKLYVCTRSSARVVEFE